MILLILSPDGMVPDSANGTTATGMAESAPSVIRINSSAWAAGLLPIITASISNHVITMPVGVVPLVLRFVI